MASVFTKIIRGEFSCFRIYEDSRVLAFLSIDPIQPGHTLIVPKEEVDHYVDVKPEDYSAVMALAQPLGRAIQAATDCRRVGLAVQGFEVPHFHLHLIPMWGTEDFDFKKAHRIPEAEMKAVQEKIVGKLKV